METRFAKLKNFWYYYKIPVGIGLLVLIAAVYLSAQSAGTPEPDYHVGLISTTPRSDAALEALTDSIAAAGEDRNGDGQVLVKLHNYPVVLGIDAETAVPDNYEMVAALDADLIGSVSGLFLTENPDSLQYATNGLFAELCLLYEDGLYLCIRADGNEGYQALFEAMK